MALLRIQCAYGRIACRVLCQGSREPVIDSMSVLEDVAKVMRVVVDCRVEGYDAGSTSMAGVGGEGWRRAGRRCASCAGVRRLDPQPKLDSLVSAGRWPGPHM